MAEDIRYLIPAAIEAYTNSDNVQIPAHSNKEREAVINENLYYITLPKANRPPDYVGAKMFPTHFNAVTGQYALEFDFNATIKVHPDKNIKDLVDMFPDLTAQTKGQLAWLIDNSVEFHFRTLIPSDTIMYTAAELLTLDSNWII